MGYIKVDKEFVISSDEVNEYGFVLKTAGWDSSKFLQNPIGFLEHDADDGVFCMWENIRVADGVIYGTPVINDQFEDAEKRAEEIRTGFLRGASVGGIEVLEYHFEGETIVVDKWTNKEVAIVAMPGNRTSYTLELSDKDGNNLLELIKQNMSKQTIPLNKEVIEALNLSDSSEGVVNAAVGALVADRTQLLQVLNLGDKASGADALAAVSGLIADHKGIALVLNLSDKATSADVLAGVKDLADKHKELQGQVVKAKVDAILEKALAEGRLTIQLSDTLAKDYATNPTGLEAVVSAMPAYKSITEKLTGDDLPKDLSDKTYREIEKAGRLDELKKYPDVFRQKYKQEYGTDAPDKFLNQA